MLSHLEPELTWYFNLVMFLVSFAYASWVLFRLLRETSKTLPKEC